MTKEVYCLMWSGNRGIPTKEYYTDIERAKKRVDHCNRHLPWLHKTFGFRWVLVTLKEKK